MMEYISQTHSPPGPQLTEGAVFTGSECAMCACLCVYVHVQACVYVGIDMCVQFLCLYLFVYTLGCIFVQKDGPYR